MPIIRKPKRPKKTIYEYIQQILKDKNKNIDKAYELEKLFRMFKDSDLI